MFFTIYRDRIKLTDVSIKKDGESMIDVVIVDDDVYVRNGLQKVIKWEELGARLVAVCKNGKEVMEFLSQHKADVVISDVKMPLMDGLSLSKYVSNNCPDTVIILLSAYQEFELLQEALEYGVRRYILKPINKKKLKQLSEIMIEVNEEKEQKRKLTSLIYNSDFGKTVKKAFVERDMKVIDSILTLDKYFNRINNALAREYYSFLFKIMAEFARELNTEHSFEESLLSEFRKCTSEAEYKTFFIETYENIMRYGISVQSRKENLTIEKIKDYIEKHYTEQGLSTIDVANRFNISTAYLGTLFKKNENCTVVDYITRKKIKKATQLIKETDLTITYIASLVGYEDFRYFSKVFKNVMNMSPTEYSRQHRKGGIKQ